MDCFYDGDLLSSSLIYARLLRVRYVDIQEIVWSWIS